MLIVVDANVLCTALLAKGKTRSIIFSDRIELIAPEKLFSEVEKHKSELGERSKLSKEEIEELLVLLKSEIEIIPITEFADRLEEASNLLKEHTKDVEYVALALKMRCPLWSKEKRLKNIPPIMTLDADEVEQRLFSSP